MDQADSSKVDFRRLITILHMAHKFCFPDHEKWAKTLVEKYCLADGENGGLLGQCSIKDFKQIYTLGFELKSDDLMTPAREQWLKHLSSEPKDDPAFSFKGFLDFAEELDDRQLQAQIYYFKLLKMKPENCALVNPVPSNNFIPTQMLRLYHGFCSLSSFWASSRLPPSPIEFGGENNGLTGHKSNCAQNWKKVWKQGMPGDPQRPIFDPLGALERFLDCDTAKSNGCCCRVYGQYLLSSIRDDLHHHFLGSFLTDV